MSRILPRFAKKLPFLVWGALTLFGFAALATYSLRAGPESKVSAHWPEQTAITREKSTPHLLLFAHPRCPCTDASLAELERLMPSLKQKVQVWVVMVHPTGKPNAWIKTSNFEKAKSMADVHVFDDVDGVESKRFNAHTSGEVALYSAAGELVFQGGITPFRGHQGDSPGQTIIRDYVNRKPASVGETQTAKVFGCRLMHE